MSYGKGAGMKSDVFGYLRDNGIDKNRKYGIIIV